MPTTVPARVVIGVDVARFGRDRSVITVRRGNVVEDIQVYPYIDTMALAGRVVVAVRERNPDLVNVDEIGLGSGVVDRLQLTGCKNRAYPYTASTARCHPSAKLRAPIGGPRAIGCCASDSATGISASPTTRS